MIIRDSFKSTEASSLCFTQHFKISVLETEWLTVLVLICARLQKRVEDFLNPIVTELDHCLKQRDQCYVPVSQSGCMVFLECSLFCLVNYCVSVQVYSPQPWPAALELAVSVLSLSTTCCKLWWTLPSCDCFNRHKWQGWAPKCTFVADSIWNDVKACLVPFYRLPSSLICCF